MWIRFTADYLFSPAALKGRVSIAYRAGTVANVTHECGEAALATGKAEPRDAAHENPEQGPAQGEAGGDPEGSQGGNPQGAG
jgi:hypothetical protein